MENRHAYPFVLDVCMLFVSLMYIGFAMSGYLCFGDATQSIITSNLADVAPKVVVHINLVFTVSMGFLLGSVVKRFGVCRSYLQWSYLRVMAFRFSRWLRWQSSLGLRSMRVGER